MSGSKKITEVHGYWSGNNMNNITPKIADDQHCTITTGNFFCYLAQEYLTDTLWSEIVPLEKLNVKNGSRLYRQSCETKSGTESVGSRLGHSSSAELISFSLQSNYWDGVPTS